MATIEEYKTGKAAKAVRLAYDVLTNTELPLADTKYEKIFKEKIRELTPIKLDKQTAIKRIREAGKHALGERLCRSEFPDSPSTNAVFLDELADAMMETGRAAHVTEDEAVKALKEGKKGPIVMSRISGRYMEMCVTMPKHCFYWNCKKRGIKCFGDTEDIRDK